MKRGWLALAGGAGTGYEELGRRAGTVKGNAFQRRWEAGKTFVWRAGVRWA